MKKINRKDFLKRAAILGASTVSFTAFLESCGGNNKPVENDPCGDTSKLTAAELQTRETFMYTGKSPYEDKVCSICSYYVAPKANEHCATCEVVKGPINPMGYCNSFVKKQA